MALIIRGKIRVVFFFWLNMKHVWRDRKKKRASTTITKIGLSKISSNRKHKNSKTFAFIFLVQNQRDILILNAQCSEGKIIFLFFFPPEFTWYLSLWWFSFLGKPRFMPQMPFWDKGLQFFPVGLQFWLERHWKDCGGSRNDLWLNFLVYVTE